MAALHLIEQGEVHGGLLKGIIYLKAEDEVLGFLVLKDFITA